LSDKIPHAQRRLAAIVFCDMVGYSYLMEESETQALQLLGEYRQIAAKTIQEHSGEIIDTVGDGLFAAFGSAVDAVRAAVAIQKELAARNRREVGHQPLLARIGIHLGDLLQEGQHLFGSRVNVASRIEVLAPPGGIYVSGEVYQQVRNQKGLSFRDIGERQLRNIKDPVRIYDLMPGEEAGEEHKEKFVSGSYLHLILAAAFKEESSRV
jgi:adenylate cyclase